tara:strand:- start:48 stop:440 length:393 start_codon:yes stop_codon:yes gene_type:complete
MSEYKTAIEPQVGTSIVRQTQVPPAGGAALVSEISFSGAIRTYCILIDNTLNSEITYLRFWDTLTAGAARSGTDAPFMILKADAATKVQYNFDKGIYFGTGIMTAAVTTVGTTGNTSPTGNVNTTYLLGA